MTFFTLALLEHNATLRCLLSYVLRPLKMPQTKFGNYWTFIEYVLGVLARALRRTDEQTDRQTDKYYPLSCAAEAT